MRLPAGRQTFIPEHIGFAKADSLLHRAAAYDMFRKK